MLAHGRASWKRTGEKQRADRRAKYAEKRAERPSRVILCRYCGKEITHKAGRAKWCSDSCRAKFRHVTDPDLARRSMATWRANNPERAKQYLSTWRTANIDRVRHHAKDVQHRRRAQKAATTGLGISLTAWNGLVARFRGRCAYCGSHPRPGEVLEQDHVVPLSRGGAHSEGNILPACPRCNRVKNDRFVMEVRTGRRTKRRRRPADSKILTVPPIDII